MEQVANAQTIQPEKVQAAEGESTRLLVIDQLRGIAMILMALEHIAFFTHANIQAESFGGVMPHIYSTLTVLVGTLTHQASGIFFTLAGASVAFFESSRRKRGWSEWHISRFFLIRAGILLVLDQVAGLFAWMQPLTFDVLSAVAFSLIVLSVVRLMNLRAIAVIAVVLFLAYPLLVQAFPPQPDQPLSLITTVLVGYQNGGILHVEFAALSRLPLVLIGFVFGQLVRQGKLSISPRLLWIAFAGLLIAFVLRLLGGYGNFLPYQRDWPLIYFFIENKQPPSIVFLLSNFSISIIWLVALNAWQSRARDQVSRGVGSVLAAFGQTSLFFYVAHLFLYSWIINPLIPRTFLPYESGLGRAILECVLGLIILYPLCLGYRHLRHTYPNSLLRYI